MLLDDPSIQSFTLPSIHHLYTLLLPSGSGADGFAGQKGGGGVTPGHRRAIEPSTCEATSAKTTALHLLGRPVNKTPNCFPNQRSGVVQREAHLFLLLLFLFTSVFTFRRKVRF